MARQKDIRITIEQPVSGKDENGYPVVNSNKVIKNAWAERRFKYGNNFDNGIYMDERMATYNIWYDEKIQPEHIIKDGKRTYKILEIETDAMKRNMSLKATAWTV